MLLGHNKDILFLSRLLFSNFTEPTTLMIVEESISLGRTGKQHKAPLPLQ